MRTVAINQRAVREGFIPLLIMLTLLLVGATCVDAKESIKFVNELRDDIQLPVDVALAPSGDIYVLDQKMGQVHVYDQQGNMMYSFAEYGSGWGKLTGPQSIAISRDGDVIIADTGNKRVQVFNSLGRFIYELGHSGAKPGQFSEPTNVAIDQYGYIYVTDAMNKNLSKFSPKGVFLEATPLDSNPQDMVIDVQQNMYLLNTEENRIEKRPLDDGYTEFIEFTWEGRDYIAAATKMEVDMRGDIYLIDGLKDSIVKIDSSQNLLLSFGSKGVGKGQFSKPMGIISDDSGKIYIADSKNKRLQIIEVNGSMKASLTPVNGKPPIVDYAMTIPAERYISDVIYSEENGLFALVDDNGRIIHKELQDIEEEYVYGDFENRDLWMRNPQAMHILSDGKMLVADTGNNRLQFLNSDGSHDYFFGNKGIDAGQFDSLQGIAVHKDGQIYIADTKNNRIQIFNSDGIYLDSFGQKGEMEKEIPPEIGYFHHPKTLEFDSSGTLYVLDRRNKRIQLFDKDGTAIKQIGSIEDSVRFMDPVDIAIDENDYLYVADRGAHRIKVLDQFGAMVTEFGSAGKGRSYFPQLSSVSAHSGKIYVADYEVDEIKVFDIHPNGQWESNSQENMPMEQEMAKADAPMEKPRMRLKLSANEADAMPEEIPMQVELNADQSSDEQKLDAREPSDLVDQDLEQDPQRLYFTQVSYPLKTENMDESLRIEMMRKMTLQLAIANVANQYGVPIESIKTLIKIEKEDILDDGRLKMTVSIPKDISSPNAQNADPDKLKMSQL